MEDKSSLAALTAEVAELRAALNDQRETFTQVIARQQAEINALRHTTLPALTSPAPDMDERANASPASAEPLRLAAPPQGTSRRGLLRGAAAGAAAAAVAAVAVGGAEQAHAAPQITGGNFILGQTNDANVTTSLVATTSTSPNPLLSLAVSQGQALYAVSTSGAGLYGSTTSGRAVYAYADTGTGVYALVNSGIAVKGISTNGIDISSGGTGRMQQALQSAAGAPASGTYSAGESIRDLNGELWLCTSSGTPGTWVRVAHVAPGASGGAITFLSAPIRLLDTRLGFPAYYHPGVKLSTGNNQFQVNGITYNSVTIPANATGMLGNVTVLDETAGGFISLFPANVSFPGTANLAFSPGQVVSNAFTSGLGLLPATSVIGVDVYLSGGVSTDVIVDIFAVVV